MRKIATGLSDVRVGGSYLRFVKMVRTLAENGFKIVVVSTSPVCVQHPNVLWKQLGSLSPAFLQTGIFLLIYPFIMMYLALAKGVGEIIAYGPVYACLLSPLRLCKKCRIYCMVRGMLSSEYSYQGKNKVLCRLVAFLERTGLHTSHRVIAVSETLGDRIRKDFGIRPEKISYLPNEIPDLSQENIDRLYGVKIWKKKLPGEGLRLFAGGIITAIKNYELLLEASALLKIPFHLCVAGRPANQHDTEYFSQLKTRVKQLKLEGRVSWLGWLPRERLLGILASSHLLLGASFHEGMSNIFLEALALNIPCLAKKTREAEELLRSDELLFQTPEELAYLVERYHQNEAVRQKITTLCRKAKKHWSFNWNERLIETLLS